MDEYHYDALGRRVLLRSRQDSLCTTECLSHVTRFVWDGNQLLHELRAAGGDSDNPESEISSGRDYREIAYTHGPSTDQPLGLVRSRYSNDNGFYDPFLIVPHANWRGQYDSGTLDDGSLIACPGGDWRFCLDIDWPGQRLGVYVDEMSEPDTWADWMGSLLSNQADQSGLQYKRNRYYDPATGQFTQQDPIGLAGGLNVYGFAAGDPVSYSDPFGLSPCWIIDPSVCDWGAIGSAVSSAYNAAVAYVRQAHDETIDWLRNDPVGQMAAMAAIGAIVDGTTGGSAGALFRPNPLRGTRYTAKVRQQMRQGDLHSFPLQVDNFAGQGTVRTITGGDGIKRTKVQLRGSYKGRDGTFEWIIEPDKTVNHRLFVPDQR